jgi:hypothetical protein
LLLGLANSVWIIAAHVLLYNAYISRHAQEAAMMQGPNLPASPKAMMILVGLVIGLISGVVIGILTLLAGKLVKVPSAPANQAVA